MVNSVIWDLPHPPLKLSAQLELTPPKLNRCLNKTVYPARLATIASNLQLQSWSRARSVTTVPLEHNQTLSTHAPKVPIALRLVYLTKTNVPRAV
jgi:hypothetical protein